MSFDLGHVGVVELGVTVAAMAYIVERILDATGRSRASRTLRTENTDLVRINDELSKEVTALRSEVKEQHVEIAVLTSKVGELQARDQQAVLNAIELHEARASERAERYVAVLVEIRDSLSSALAGR